MTKFAGRGLTISFEGSPIGQLTAFGEIGSQRDLIDASAFGDDWKDYVLGQQDGVEVAATIAYDPDETGHAALVTAYETQPDDVFQVGVAHADAGWSAQANVRITQLTRGATLDGLFQMSVTFKIVEPGVTES